MPDLNAGLRRNYVPVSSDLLFESLSAITDVLDWIGVPYVLTGGTLLGAIRQQDLIKGDSDWDVDVRTGDVPEIMRHAHLFEAEGFTPISSIEKTVEPLVKGTLSKRRVLRGLVKFTDAEGAVHGDLFMYELFSDGIMRQVNIAQRAYFNAKMSYPAWFFENSGWAEIRGRRFRVPAEPEVYLERMYGPLWRTPIKRFGKNIPKGYNFAGAYEDANIEHSIALALSMGWVPYYPGAPLWPMQIDYAAPSSVDWIRDHENLHATDPRPDLSVDQNAALRAMQLQLEVRKLRGQLSYKDQMKSKLRGRIKRLRSEVASD